jgi:hypothetical protein
MLKKGKTCRIKIAGRSVFVNRAIKIFMKLIYKDYPNHIKPPRSWGIEMINEEITANSNFLPYKLTGVIGSYNKGQQRWMYKAIKGQGLLKKQLIALFDFLVAFF